MEPPKFRSLYIFMNKNVHFIILVSFCRPHSDFSCFSCFSCFSLVLLSMYKDSEIYRCILNFYLSNTIVLKFWKVIISYLYLLERKFFQRALEHSARSRWSRWSLLELSQYVGPYSRMCGGPMSIFVWSS